MHRVPTAAAFIKANMPLGQGGTLTDQQAWDVAAFMNSHSRGPARVDPSAAKGQTLTPTADATREGLTRLANWPSDCSRP